MIRGLIAFVFLLVIVQPARADELTDLVDRHIAWRGGAAFERLETIEARGQIETAGLQGPIHYWYGRDGRSRAEADLGVVKSLTVAVPDGGYSLTQSGEVEDLSGVQREQARRVTMMEFGIALRGGDGARVSLAGDEQRDGGTWKVVRITIGGNTYDLFLNGDSGALMGARITEDRRTRFETYDDWRLVDGVRMPFRTRVKAEVATSDSLVTLDAVTLNHPLDTALFARPAAVRKARFDNGATSTGWIDFDFYAGNRIFIPAIVNGVPVAVLLDSGAESTVLSKAFADSAGLKSQGEVTAMGTGGTASAGLIRDVDIRIGGLTLENLTVASLDLSGVERAFGRPLPVILGKEVFNQLIVEIDFKGRRIAFHDPAGFTPPAGAAEVPVTLVDGLRAVPVSIEGRPPVLFDFDIGNGSPLIIFPSYAAAETLLDGRPQSTVMSGAVGGLREGAIAAIERLEFAGVTFTRVPTLFPPAGPSAVDTDHTRGNLGLPILSRFRLITDYSRNRLYLVADADTAAPFPFDRLGLALRIEGDGFVADYVARGSPAEAAGVKKGDTIRLIDGRPASGWTREALRGLRYDQTRVGVELTMTDGVVRKVAMKTYF